MTDNDTTTITRDYYNSSDADEFYHEIWGGEDIHIGLYKSDEEPIETASRRSVATMAERANIAPEMHVLDLGSGYGGAARYLAHEIGCRVQCLNLSATENERNNEKNQAAGLADKITVVEGDFENLEFADESFDVVWSEDAILHAGDKARVFHEIARVLKPGGHLIFTDPMQADDCPEGVLEPVLARIHLKSLGSIALYRALCEKNSLTEVEVLHHNEQLPRHYARVRNELQKRYGELSKRISNDYLDRMLAGLGHWVDAGNKGYLAWGILHFKK